MNRTVNKRIFIILICFMMLATSFMYPVNAYADTYDEPCYEMAVKLTDAAFEYMDEIYVEKFPELGLRPLYMDPLSETELRTLAEKTTSGKANDLAKAKAIVNWIRSSIEYTYNLPPYPTDVFRNRKGDCMGMAQLGSQLMRLIGIPAVAVDGWRADTRIITQTQLFNDLVFEGHAWIYAYIGGDWLMFDPLWSGDCPITDREFMASHYYVNTIEAVAITYDGMDLNYANEGRTAVYADGKFKYFSYGGYTDSTGIEFFSVNGIVFNTFTHQEEDQYTYVDYPEKAEAMEAGELYTDGWFAVGVGAEVLGESKYAYENGLMAAVNFLERDGKLYYADRNNNIWYLGLDEKDYWIEQGDIAISQGAGSFKPEILRPAVPEDHYCEYTLTRLSDEKEFPVTEDGYVGNLEPGDYAWYYIEKNKEDPDVEYTWANFYFTIKPSRPTPNYTQGNLNPMIVDVGLPRIYGNTRYETSLKAADAFKEQLGIDKFDTVILADGRNYADALAGSYLSCVKNAPILLVDSRNDHISAVQEYIKKNLNPGGMIYMLGGTAVVPDASVAGLSGYNTKRLWGTDRYATNVAILEEAGVSGDEILVASGTGFADSLSASATGKPILLVKNEIQASQKDYVGTLKGKKFYLIGGTGAVNTSLESYFKSLGSVTRIGGATRYDTSVNVAKTFFKEPKAAVLAFGANFPDGLCGGSLAYAMGGPLLLAANGKTAQSKQFVSDNGIYNGVILGGPALISDSSVYQVFS